VDISNTPTSTEHHRSNNRCMRDKRTETVKRSQTCRYIKLETIKQAKQPALLLHCSMVTSLKPFRRSKTLWDKKTFMPFWEKEYHRQTGPQDHSSSSTLAKPIPHACFVCDSFGSGLVRISAVIDSVGSYIRVMRPVSHASRTK
jgi:hypothetical protein